MDAAAQQTEVFTSADAGFSAKSMLKADPSKKMSLELVEACANRQTDMPCFQQSNHTAVKIFNRFTCQFSNV
jgi:hypothetical protein